MYSFFKDLKVVELANVLAGPAVGMFFAELGADVIKIENRTTGGDVTRSWKLPSEDKTLNTSAYYASVNWNKKVRLLDIKNKDERAKVYELLRDADIVITNYKAGDAVKLGMDFDTLKKINPTLIYAHLSGFGEDSKRTAFDIVLQAETGYMFMNGTTESGPIKMPVALIDILAAHQLKEGILVALINRIKTGAGCKVTVSLFDAAVASLANQATNWLMAAHDPQPMGSLHPNIAPYGELFTTADQKLIVLAVGNDKQFKQLCAVLKLNTATANEKFISNTDRVRNRKELFEVLQTEIIKHSSDELMKELINADVPAGLIKSVKELLENKSCEKLILEEKDATGIISSRIKTSIFNITR
ncbi:MAG: CoA transferase [Bacteroidetes bacterium]|nr:CoA transferase [Bacteroidota bacterium]